ncbi:MAG: hypothetical protein BMS9Abin28_1813 [Anaerolineae bacterium]|nr:MAG: hypothetical protein BMS9Abin28_1813 [Anaerolineae bacterium]
MHVRILKRHGVKKVNANLRTTIGKAAILSVAFLILGACTFIRTQTQPSSTSTPLPSTLPVDEEVVIRGFVTENRLGCRADASCSLFILVNGRKIKVAYEWGGEVEPCKNTASDQGFEIQEGDEVEVFGRVTPTGRVSTCDSEDYYIRNLR